MRTTFRRYLLMLLILILPLQALASASMLGCISAPAPEQSDNAPMQMTGCHESDHPDNRPAPHNHKHKHCAVCALATVLSNSFSDSPAPLTTSLRFIAQSVAALSGFIPDSLERPPRLPLA